MRKRITWALTVLLAVLILGLLFILVGNRWHWADTRIWGY